MNTKEKSGASLYKAEVKATSLTGEDFDRLDSVYSRIVNASDDLAALIEDMTGERGSMAAWYILENAKEEIKLSIQGMEKILYGDVE